MLSLSNKKVLVVGLGKSGQSVAKKALKAGARVSFFEDDKEKLKGGEDLDGIKPVKLFGKADFDLLVTSPGIPFDHEIIHRAAENSWPVMSEVEFSYLLMEPKFIIGITGTNEKTTVVELLGHIFALSSKPYTIAGNIGTPLSSLDRVEGTLIMELSSFQLHFIDKFRVNIGAILNVKEDHLDWHCCFGQYMEDKLNIFKNQKAEDIALINSDDEVLSKKKLTNGKVLSFGVKNKADYSLDNGCLQAKDQEIIGARDISLKGTHNISNALAASACAFESGISLKIIKKGLKSFKGLKHRLQFVASKKGVSFFNDSKSTNPDSTLKAVEAFNSPVVLIIGGRNKGNEFSVLKKHIGNQIKGLVLYGEAADEIKKQIGNGHINKTVEEAVFEANILAGSGDTILFSPGCSSFDQFENYAQRGDVFVDTIESLDG